MLDSAARRKAYKELGMFRGFDLVQSLIFLNLLLAAEQVLSTGYS